MNEHAAAFDEFIDSLRRVWFALRALSARMLQDLDCTAVERGVLSDLQQQGPQTVPQLAQARAVSRQALQKAADRMLGRGLLAAGSNPRHRRSVLLAPTPAGTALLREIRSRERRLLARLRLPIGDTQLRRTTQALRALGEFFAGEGGEHGGRGASGGRSASRGRNASGGTVG